MTLQLFKVSDETAGIINVFDSWGSSVISSLHSDGMTVFMKVMSEIFDPMIVIAAGLLIALFFWIKKMRFEAFVFGGSVAAAAALVWTLKHIVGRPRPLNALIEETGYSFPSGHALVSLVFFLVLYFVCKRRMSAGSTRKILFIIALILPFIIGTSRIYLGVHHLSDIFGGFILGSIIVSIAIMLIEGNARRATHDAIAKARE